MTLGKIPFSAEEALQQWDAGMPVFTVELGGLGPGYEQTIHIGIFELLRKLKDVPLPKDDEEKLDALFREKMLEVDREQALGMSGAQAGVAKAFAYRVLTKGWTAVVLANKVSCGTCGSSREMMVSKAWPGRPPAPAAAGAGT